MRDGAQRRWTVAGSPAGVSAANQIRKSGSEGGVRFEPSFLPLSNEREFPITFNREDDDGVRLKVVGFLGARASRESGWASRPADPTRTS